MTAGYSVKEKIFGGNDYFATSKKNKTNYMIENGESKTSGTEIWD